MRNFFTFLTCLAFSSFALSQVTPEIQWAKTYGGSDMEIGYEIIQTADGGYISIGYTNSDDGDITENKGWADLWVVKTDAAGTIEWQKTYGGSQSDVGASLKQTPDGGYIIGGSIQSGDGDISDYNGELGFGEDFWIVKISSTGEIEWENNYGGNYPDILTDLQLTTDGGYIAIGNTMSKSGDVVGGYGTEGNFFQEGWVVKIDAQGDIEWQRPYGGYEGFVQFSNIQQTTDGGYIIGGDAGYGFDGDFPETNGGSDFWALKISSVGEIEWSKVYGGSSEDYAGKITQTSDGGYIFVGGVYSNDGDVEGGYGNGNGDAWILKLNNTGELEWKNTIGGAGGDGARIAYETADNHFVIGGGTSSSDGDFTDFPNNGMQNKILMKLNSSDGSIIWMKSMGGSANDILFDLKTTNDGGFITIGSSSSNDGDVSGNHGSADFWIVKLGPDCLVPELTIDTTHTICAGEELTLTANTEAELIHWYDAADATEPVFTGTEFELPELTETTSFWVEAANYICKTDRIEIIVNVNPLPVLEAETTYAICSENSASLYASSPSNVIFWYANEDDTEYLYHGNLFVTEVLTENTTYWV
ncbi:Ig-like domain-containing protein, partial [Moheibacter sediminis]